MPVVEGFPPLHIVVMIRETADPLALFAEWYGEAEKTEPNDPSALALATVAADGMPSLRMVLLKGFDPAGFVFYTNYESAKANQLQQHKQAALCILWKTQRDPVQVRIEGVIEKTTAAESDAYFATRPRESQIGAWASLQSQTLPEREQLEKRVAEFEQKYSGQAVPRPPHWGGYRVVPDMLEFWYGQRARLHERLRYEVAGNVWSKRFLYP